MKSKRNLLFFIFQLVIGILAILASVILVLNGENIIKWTITIILAVAYVVLGSIGIIDYKSNK